ncbi:MAG: hypothetical protein KDD70_16005 [Bdellovibrionales bacterium]|nr:hypothetical protein [Bdellovibrionales bacterium]
MSRRACILLSLFVGISSFLCAEYALRAFGVVNIYPSVATGYLGPAIKDAELGWRNRPGAQEYELRTDPSRTFRPTVAENSLRATSSADGSAARGNAELWFSGCSVTYGWMLEDQETFPWKVQKALPNTLVRNLGTAAYGTYQSMLFYQELVKRSDPDTSLSPSVDVLHMFVPAHPDRNVNTFEWLRGQQIHNPFGWMEIPYCLLSDDGGLDCRPPEGLPWVPLAGRSTVFGLVGEVIQKQRSRGREEVRFAVTKKLFSRFRDHVSAAGGRFHVGLLYPGDWNEELKKYLAEENISIIDCVMPQASTASRKIPNDGHPNSLMTSEWAECLVEKIKMLGDFRQ